MTPRTMTAERAPLPEWAQIKPGTRCQCPGEDACGCTHGYGANSTYVLRGCPHDATEVSGGLPLCWYCAERAVARGEVAS